MTTIKKSEYLADQARWDVEPHVVVVDDESGELVMATVSSPWRRRHPRCPHPAWTGDPDGDMRLSIGPYCACVEHVDGWSWRVGDYPSYQTAGGQCAARELCQLAAEDALADLLVKALKELGR